MANRYLKQFQGSLESGVVKLFGSVTTSTSGAIASQACKGFSVAKTAGEVGRYTVTLEDYYFKLLMASVIAEGAADAAYTGTKGLTPFLRNVAVSLSGKTFDVQFAQSSFADAELIDGSTFHIEISLKNSSSY